MRMKYTTGWESNTKKGSMSTTFSGSPDTMSFVAFSRTMVN